MLVLLKAPWVGITLDPQQPARPITSCRDVSVISNAGPDSEVLMTLADGQTLCATLPQAQAAGLAEGTEAIAYFNADRIILATLC